MERIDDDESRRSGEDSTDDDSRLQHCAQEEEHQQAPQFREAEDPHEASLQSGEVEDTAPDAAVPFHSNETAMSSLTPSEYAAAEENRRRVKLLDIDAETANHHHQQQQNHVSFVSQELITPDERWNHDHDVTSWQTVIGGVGPRAPGAVSVPHPAGIGLPIQRDPPTTTQEDSMVPIAAALSPTEDDVERLVQERLQEVSSQRNAPVENDTNESAKHHCEADAIPIVDDMSESPDRQGRRRRHRPIIVYAALLVFAVIIGIVAGVAMSSQKIVTKTEIVNGNGSGDSNATTTMDDAADPGSPIAQNAPSSVPEDQGKDTRAPTISPTMQPSASPTSPPLSASEQRFQMHLELLLPSLQGPPSFGTREAFDDPLSSHFLALDWLSSTSFLSNASVYTTSMHDDADDANADAGVTVSPTELRQLLQRYILALLYFSTRGPAWEHQFGFLSEASVCEWHDADGMQGITCNDEFEVDAIVLENNYLDGQLPMEVFLLTSLTVFSVWNNPSLDGCIPTSIANIQNLTALDVAESHFDGPIPTEIGLLTSLEHLMVHDSYMNGTIPSEIGALTNLQRLGIFKTSMNGTIPEELFHATSLEYIAMSRTRISGTLSTMIGALPGITRLFLSETNIGGAIPSEIYSLSDLEKLVLFDTTLHGTIQTEIGALTMLDDLILHKTNINGTIPTEIGKLANLVNLRVDRTGVTGTIPSQIGELTKLEVMHLFLTELSGFVPSEMDGLKSLKAVGLDGTRLVGNLDPIFCHPNSNIRDIWASCGGSTTDGNLSLVTCSCCTHCCQADGSECVDRSPRTSSILPCYDGDCTSCGNGRFVPACDSCIYLNVSTMVEINDDDEDDGTEFNETEADEEELCLGSCVWNSTAATCQTRMHFPFAPPS